MTIISRKETHEGACFNGRNLLASWLPRLQWPGLMNGASGL
jgi:hypothetical protein